MWKDSGLYMGALPRTAFDDEHARGGAECTHGSRRVTEKGRQGRNNAGLQLREQGRDRRRGAAGKEQQLGAGQGEAEET